MEKLEIKNSSNIACIYFTPLRDGTIPADISVPSHVIIIGFKNGKYYSYRVNRDIVQCIMSLKDSGLISWGKWVNNSIKKHYTGVPCENPEL